MSELLCRRMALWAGWRIGLLCLCLLGWGGCFAGSLASTTGPTTGTWSNARHQLVHVGETVQFSFVLKKALATEGMHAEGVADYCVFNIGGDRLQADINELGTFRATYTFDRAAPGDVIPVKATAYRQYNQRDRMEIHGEWLKNQSPNNEPDQPLASASIRLTAYQSEVRLHLPPSPDDYDISTGRLVLRPNPDALVPVYAGEPGVRGFTAAPAEDGGWIITYQPDGTEVSPYGLTQVEFSVYDLAGRERVFTDTLETP